MTIKDLAIRFSQTGVPSNKYCLTGGLPNEAYCIEMMGGKWHVYYSERGTRTGLRVFDSEQAACDYLFQLVTR